MIGNKYNVSFNIRNDELLGNTFTGTFSNQSLDLILKHFSISSKIKFRRIDQDGRRQSLGGPGRIRSLLKNRTNRFAYNHKPKNRMTP